MEIRNMEEQVLSILQVQELEKLGVDTNCGSMYWHNYNTSNDPQYELCSNADVGDITTFTLQDILEMLPKNIIHSNKQLKTCNYKLCTFDNKVMYTFNSFDQGWLKCTYGKNLLEAAFEMLKWCKQNNHL